jgi:hypothetical protein
LSGTCFRMRSGKTYDFLRKKFGQTLDWSVLNWFYGLCHIFLRNYFYTSLVHHFSKLTIEFVGSTCWFYRSNSWFRKVMYNRCTRDVHVTSNSTCILIVHQVSIQKWYGFKITIRHVIDQNDDFDHIVILKATSFFRHLIDI